MKKLESEIPTLDAAQALNGKNFAMLSVEEQAVLSFYRDQGRKFNVTVEILTDADPKELARASRQQADEIMRRVNSHIRITIGKDAQDALGVHTR